MEEYKSNSYRSKEAQKNDNVKPEDRKIEKVVTGVV